jgi:hypothetical protein
MSNEELAKAAYDAYGQAVGGLNYLGNPMPAWEDLPMRISMAWEVAAIAVKNAVNIPDS